MRNRKKVLAFDAMESRIVLSSTGEILVSEAINENMKLDLIEYSIDDPVANLKEALWFFERDQARAAADAEWNRLIQEAAQLDSNIATFNGAIPEFPPPTYDPMSDPNQAGEGLKQYLDSLSDPNVQQLFTIP